MDQSYISPFVASIQNVFTTMLQLPVSVGEASATDSGGDTDGVWGEIEMTGQVEGSMVLCMTRGVAEQIVALFSGERLSVDEPDFADAFGELANMIAGGAKAQFPGGGPVDIGCPSVSIGERSGNACSGGVYIPCDTDCGAVTLAVTIIECADRDNDLSSGVAA